MMNAPTKTKRYTYDDFCVLVKDGQKGDLIDGEIYMASPENLGSFRLFRWIFRVMDDFVEQQILGEVFASRIAFRLDEHNAPEPDIAFVRLERLHYARRGFFDGQPDLAIEIVSPESVDRDYQRKRELYQSFGVSEYWILDEISKSATFLRLNKKGIYREVKTKNGIFASQVVNGFWLRTEWLWQEPRPKKNDVVAEILGGLPS